MRVDCGPIGLCDRSFTSKHLPKYFVFALRRLGIMRTTSATTPSDLQKLRDHAISVHPDLGVAFNAALAAGKIIADGFGKFHTIDQKGVGDFVSEVDQMADKVVCEILAGDKCILDAGRSAISFRVDRKVLRWSSRVGVGTFSTDR